MCNLPGAVFPRRLDRRLPMAVRSEGVWITDSEGKRYLDASGGAVVVNVGHGREEIARAVGDQLRNLSYVHGTMFTHSAVEDLALALAEHAPDGIGRFYFLSSGSEAVEAAIKLARQIHVAAGRFERVCLVSRWKSYHGLTLGALAATGRASFRKPFLPLLRDAVHIPPPYCLRCSYGLSHPECGLRCALALDETIQNLGPEVVSAFLAETVGGATLASCPPPQGYLALVREICDRHGVLLILDEVMCGMGRTGKWFATEHWGVKPDLITLGKGLSGGTLALSAVGTRPEHLDVVSKGSGNFVHGGTFSHNTAACAAGLAAVRILEKENLVARCALLGEQLGTKLRERLGGSPHVGEIRGIGLMWGVELVQDRKTLAPFPRSLRVAERVWESMFRRGVLTYTSVGLAGRDGDALMIAPPFIIEEKELDLAVDGLALALTETLG